MDDRAGGRLAAAANRNQGEVDLVRGEPAQQLPARLAGDVDLHEGMGQGKAREDARQEAGRVIVGRAEPDDALDVVGTEAGHRLFLQPQDPPRVAEQGLPVRGKGNRAPILREDRPADDVLEPLHLHGDRRGRAQHGLRGSGEAARRRHRNERAQEVGVEPAVRDVIGTIAVERHPPASQSIRGIDA